MSNNRVTQIKTAELTATAPCKDLRFAQSQRVNKAEAGHFAKAGVEAGRGLQEFALDAAKLGELKVGDAITVEVFQVGQLVDVTGTSQGKGFAGSIKRHNFSSNRALTVTPCRTASGLHRYGPGSGSRVSGQAHGRSAG